MKYVRTQDRIGEKAEPSEDCPIVEDEHWLLLTNGLIHKDKEPIITEADTPEELCDEFRYDFTKDIKHKRCFYIRKEEKWYDYDSGFELNEKEISTIRAGIWTDKGFSYVLKMNDEGKLVVD